MMIKIAQSKFPAAFNQLELIRKFVEQSAVKLGLTSDVIYDLILAITEIVTNTIEHGYQEKGGMIEVNLHQEGGDFIMQVRDEAPVFDPQTAPKPDISLPLGERPLGGLGLHIVNQLMDSVSHRVTETGGNEITLVKRGILEFSPTEELTNESET